MREATSPPYATMSLDATSALTPSSASLCNHRPMASVSPGWRYVPMLERGGVRRGWPAIAPSIIGN